MSFFGFRARRFFSLDVELEVDRVVARVFFARGLRRVSYFLGRPFRSLVRMVTELGHHLGVSIVAEGVETDDQLAALREVGCDSLQGFLIGRPLAVEHLIAWREEHTSGETHSGRDQAA